MKHLFLKLSVVMLTLYFLAMSVSADPVDNQDTVDRRVILSADGSCNLFNRTASNPLLCPEIRSGTSEYIRFGTSIDFESDRHGSSGAEAIGLFFEREI